MNITPEQVHAGAVAVGWCVGFVCGVVTTIVASIFVAELPDEEKITAEHAEGAEQP